ncbi:hypothetical protein B0H15DRAFT_383213 [Mycena belliarum]|uniref:DUF6534 domain-containing protein n=1 Tax=Mycena belliarum TaxID=1033014 RepID=A0AAD6TZL4_9AGAR|nr:hypothetical protein B0H15DRAFT_383213 [Mycena belliae]
MLTNTSLLLSPSSLAPVAIGSWVNLVLFTLEAVQVLQYFSSRARRHDSGLIALGVSQNFAADIVGTLACCAMAYMHLVINQDKAEAMENQFWALTVVVFTVGVVTSVSQLFMICRYWQMTKHHAVLVLLLVILSGAVTGIFGCGVLMILPEPTQSRLLNVFVLLALIATVICNVLVSVLLFWQRFKRTDARALKPSIPSRVISALIETGTISTAVSIAGTALSFGSVRDKMIWIIFAFIQARVYSCTMLFVLLRRPELVTAGQGSVPEAPYIGSDKQAAASSMFASTASVTLPTLNRYAPNRRPVGIMNDADAFRLTKKPIELPDPAYDSDSSSLSRQLNDELRTIAERRSRRMSRSSAGSMEEQPEARCETPSEYPTSPFMSPSPGPPSPSNYPVSPLILSPRSGSPQAF